MQDRRRKSDARNLKGYLDWQVDTDEADDGASSFPCIFFLCVFLVDRLGVLWAARLFEMNATKGVKGETAPKGTVVGIILRWVCFGGAWDVRFLFQSCSRFMRWSNK